MYNILVFFAKMFQGSHNQGRIYEFFKGGSGQEFLGGGGGVQGPRKGKFVGIFISKKNNLEELNTPLDPPLLMTIHII